MNARMGFILFFLNCTITPGFSARVTASGATTAVFGQEAYLSCSLSETDGVSQVTWQRRLKDNTVENLATFSKRFGAKVMEPYVSRINFTEASLNSTSITIKDVTFADEACYICSFNVYPTGSIRKQTCITVQGIFGAKAHIDEASSDVVSCSGTGKPAPEVTWNSTADFTAVRTDQQVSNADGTFTVNSTLRLSGYSGRSIDCFLSSPVITMKRSVHLPGIVPPDKDGHSASLPWIIILVLVITSAVIGIAFTLRRKKATCGDYSSNGRALLARGSSCIAVFV
ncbi:OX-2 membrane glycoprotein-like isoform X1 [Conger conger]|uniref:OX-2 membrane glycoprotein-like isoform X1 n=1 Tax=Conger conger TaxID=82655 RepID=UPI002A5A21C0|nr:OX-2 membrane glycoprotein-like isoform X1 [Conger conger]